MTSMDDLKVFQTRKEMHALNPKHEERKKIINDTVCEIYHAICQAAKDGEYSFR